MGYLIYGSNAYAVELEDRALAHLKIAILTLLRSGKSVAFSYQRSVDAGSGRETLWINPTSELRFKFNGNRPPRINETWVHAIIATSLTPTGLRLLPESCVHNTGPEMSPPGKGPLVALRGDRSHVQIEI